MSKNWKPLFVNSSQVEKYGSSPSTSETASIAKDVAGQQNIFDISVTPSGTNFHGKQSFGDGMKYLECSNIPNSTAYISQSGSPVFGLQKPRKSCPYSLTAGDCVTSVKKQDSVSIPRMDINDISESLFTSATESSITSSPILPVKSRKRRRPLLIDSDSSDDCTVEFSTKAHRQLSSDNDVTDKSPNRVVSKSSGQKLSNLKHRHCFDMLLNCDMGKSLPNSARSLDEPLDVVNSFPANCVSQSSCRTPSRTVDAESDQSDQDVVCSVSDQCSVHLNRLRLSDVSSSIVLSQKDKLSLSGECRSADSSSLTVTSTVNDDKSLVPSDSSTSCDMGVTCSSPVHLSDVPYNSSEDLFSDNELVESVCLSPSRYCNSGEKKVDMVQEVSKPLAESLEQSSFVSYSQAEDDCILIDDSDDELFANLTQTDMTINVEDEDEQKYHSDEPQEAEHTDEDDWTQNNADGIPAAVGVAETLATSELHDPWIDDINDVSSEELEEAYDAAMRHAYSAEANDSDRTAVDKRLCRDVIFTDSECTISPCRVVLMPLRISDIQHEICSSQECKHRDGSDAVIIDTETEDDRQPDSFQRDMSVSHEVTSDTTYGNVCYGNEPVPKAADVCRKTEGSLPSSTANDFVRPMEFECGETSNIFEREADLVKDTDELCQTSLRDGFCENLAASEAAENVVKHTRGPRMALENCVEVAEFYGMHASDENRQRLRKLEDKLIQRSFSSKSHLPASKPLRDNSVHDDGKWMSKSSAQTSNTTSSSFQSQKIAQLRDCSKQNLRRDRSSVSSSKRLQNDDADRFYGLSQFSVAKQQLAERNRQLKKNGLWFLTLCLQLNVLLYT